MSNTSRVLFNLLSKYYPEFDVKIIDAPFIFDVFGITLVGSSRTIFTVCYYNEEIEITGVKSSKCEIPVGVMLKRLIPLAEEFNKYNRVNTVNFDTDTSKLIFGNISISLLYLNVLAYGQSWYNRLGFGEQPAEWSTFIQRPIGDLLKEVGIDFSLSNPDKTIAQVFVEYINILKNSPSLEVVLGIKTLIDTIMMVKKDSSYDDYIYHLYAPPVNIVPTYRLNN